MFERPGWWVAILVFYFWKEVNDVKVKKSVFCVAAAFLILFSGVFGYGVEEVRAEDTGGIASFFNERGWDIPSYINYDYKHVVMYDPYHSRYDVFGFSDNDSYLLFDTFFTNSTAWGGNVYGYEIVPKTGSDGAFDSYYLFYVSEDGVSDSTLKWDYHNRSFHANSSCTSGKYSEEQLSYANTDLDTLIPYCDVTLYCGVEATDNYGWPSEIKFIPDPVYNPELGYLQNLIEKTVYLRDSEGNIDYSTSQRIVGFDSLSTSGLDLSTGEYSIRVYEQGCYYGHDVTTVYKNDYPLIYIGEYAIENNSITYDPWEARDKTTTETEGWLSDWDLYWGQYERRDNMYYQIVKTNEDGSIEYGGYVKVARLTDNDDGISSTVTPELEPDTGGYSDDTVDSGVGSGTNYDDAEMNADDDLENNINSSDVSGDIAKDIQSLIAYIGAVPQLLGALLSFLPKEYQTLIYVAFALMLGVIVIKAVRG